MLRLSQKIPYEPLSLFCSNLGTSLHAGLDVATSLRLCAKSSQNPALREIVEQAATQAARGICLPDVLQRWQSRFPPFFVPVLRCGEESGRQDEALDYLQRHCRLLAGPARIVRNTWLAPLAIMLAGSIVCAFANLMFAPFRVTLSYVAHAATFYGVIAAVIAVVLWVPPAKAIVDGLKLIVPVIGPAERELAMNRFFHALNLLYSTGGLRVEQMIRVAADSADNFILRYDLRRAARVIERGGTIAEAFFAPLSVSYDRKALIQAGEDAGKLEDAFETIARQSDDSVQHSLIAFQQLFYRAVAVAVIGSMTATILSLPAIRG